MLSESSQDGESHEQPIVLTRRAFVSLSEVERKDLLSTVVIVKEDEGSDWVQRSVFIHSLVHLPFVAHIRGSNDDTVVSIVPASGAVSEYSTAAGGFEGLEFEQPVSVSVVDYALRCVALCLTSLARHSTCHSYCQHMLDTSGRSDWHEDIGLFTTMDTAYVVNQLVDPIRREESGSGHPSVLSDGFIEHARLAGQQEVWILPMHYESVISFFHSVDDPSLFSIVSILPSL
jgi:hypothetical protein